MHVTVDGVNFVMAYNAYIYVNKYKSRASTARELPDQYMDCWLKHGC